MKQPIYKKLLSYLFDIQIESMHSEFNESLDLVLSDGRYQLLTKGAIYSYEDKYDNFRLSFKKLNLENKAIKEVLILGMGMGSIPIILERCFNQKYNYTGVEIDAAVISLLSKYILGDIRSKVEIIETDAHIFMMQNTNHYDMICMDVFIDDQIPAIFKTKEFLVTIKNALNEGGLLLFNWLAMNDKDVQLIKDYMEQVFIQVFPNAYMINLTSNRMLVAKT